MRHRERTDQLNMHRTGIRWVKGGVERVQRDARDAGQEVDAGKVGKNIIIGEKY